MRHTVRPSMRHFPFPWLPAFAGRARVIALTGLISAVAYPCAAQEPVSAAGQAGMIARTPAAPRSGKQTSGPRAVGADQPLAKLTLVRSAGARAVVRFGAGPLELVTRGDRLGATAAVVVEVSTGRLTIEEVGSVNGRPMKTLIVLKDGDTGGARYMTQTDDKPLQAVRPVIGQPAKPKEGGR